MDLKTKQTLAVVLSIGGALGTIGTALLARKAAFKEARIYVTGVDINDKSIKERFKILLPLYLPAVLVGTLTVGSIVGSTVMSHKAQASIMSMAVLADQGWRKYKNQVKNVLGVDAHESVVKALAKDNAKQIKLPVKTDENDRRELYYEDHVGYFQATPEDIAYAYAELNEMFTTDYRNQLQDHFDHVTIGTFLKLCNAELVCPPENPKDLHNWGWTMEYIDSVYDFMWIHMDINGDVTDDGDIPINVITWKQDPILLYDEELSVLAGVKASESCGGKRTEYVIKNKTGRGVSKR